MAKRTGINYREFDIKRPGFADSINVRVYKNPKSMQRGYLEERLKYTRKKDNEDISDSVGLFITPSYIIHDHNEVRYTGDVYGIMFLNEKIITPEIVIHECAHGAFSHEENIVRFKMDYSADTLEHEERFAYYIGWLASEVLQILKEARYLR